MSQPIEVIAGRFAETAVVSLLILCTYCTNLLSTYQPTSESHLPPTQTLQMARETLLSIFRRKFEAASRSRDSTTTSRFFKLFPEIGWEAEGLEAYASFVVDLVRVRSPVSAKGIFLTVKMDCPNDCPLDLQHRRLFTTLPL
jgi:conserved oligomeric Golgi complex subunit 4